MIRRLLVLSVLLSGFVPMPALADDPPPTCDIRASNKCPSPTQVITYRAKCPRTSGMAECPEIHLPPPAEISCASSNGGVVCDAWPESDELTYRYVWSVQTANVIGGSASEFSPTFLGSCTGRAGRIAVAVIAPDGTTSSASVPFVCEQNQ